MRKLLVYVSGPASWVMPSSWNHCDFDVAFSAFDAIPKCTAPDYLFHTPLEKLHGALINMGHQLLQYDAVAFLDDDVEASGPLLDCIFRAGVQADFLVWQPALTPDSFYSWKNTVQRPNAETEDTEFVEVMCPFFSRRGLSLCLPMFGINFSGHGLDVLWSSLIPRPRKGIIHHMPVGHHRPLSPNGRRMPNGLTKNQELTNLLRERSLQSYWNKIVEG